MGDRNFLPFPTGVYKGTLLGISQEPVAYSKCSNRSGFETLEERVFCEQLASRKSLRLKESLWISINVYRWIWALGQSVCSPLIQFSPDTLNYKQSITYPIYFSISLSSPSWFSVCMWECCRFNTTNFQNIAWAVYSMVLIALHYL